MPIQRTERRSGIYNRRHRTLTVKKADEGQTDFEGESKTDFEQIGREIIRAYTPQDTLDDIDAELISLLKAFGVEVHWPGPLPKWILTPKKWPAKFNLRDFGLLPAKPATLLPDEEANADAFESACCAMDELIALRNAIKMNLTADAAMRGIRLGRLFEMLQVIPHEPDAALGKKIIQARSTGTAKGNATKKNIATKLHARIIAEFKTQKQLGGSMKKMVAIHRIIAAECECGERTVRNVLSQHQNKSTAKR